MGRGAKPHGRRANLSVPKGPALLALLLAGLAAVPGPLGAAQAQESLGVTPPEHEVEDAQRGQAYERRVTIQNQFDSPTLVTLEPLGEVGNWTSTEPASGFEIPPRSDASLRLAIRVPGDAANGLHTGFLRIVAEPKAQPSGSGFALRYAVAVVLNVTVGGEAVVRLRWVAVEAANVEVGSAPDVVVRVANEGNVRTAARGEAEVLDASGRPLATPLVATFAEEVIPGETRGIRVPFERGLPLGSYVARVRAVAPEAFVGEDPFTVCAPGCVGKEGILRFLEHEPRAEAGLPVKVTAVFENVGTVPIGRAKFTGEVYLEDTLVAVLTSDELVVPVGARANLSSFFTPTQPGTHRIVGKVTYDGFETPPNESILAVSGGAGLGGLGFALPPWAPYAGLALAALLLVALGRRRRRRRGREPRP